MASPISMKTYMGNNYHFKIAKDLYYVLHYPNITEGDFMDRLVIPAGERLEVYSHAGPFDKGIAALKAEGLELITARELAEARILGGSDHPVSREGLWVAEHPIYRNNKQADVLVVDGAHSQLLKHPVEATDAHRDGKEFYIDQKVVGELREQATPDGKHGVLLLPRQAIRKAIAVEALADDAYARFLFRDLAGQYGQFLKDAGIMEVSVYVVDAGHAREQKQPFGRALWVYDLNLISRSGLDGDNLVLPLNDGRVRGVRRMSRSG